MAQFDVYKNQNPLTNEKILYLLDIQNDILMNLNTRVVIPLSKDKKVLTGLTKEIIVDDEKVYLVTSQMGTVFLSELSQKICSVEKQKEEIKNSIDFLVYGF